MVNTHNDDRWTDRLSEYLDDELTVAERAALEEHLRGCTGCRLLLSELRAVADRARSLPDTSPTVDLWPGVAGEISSSGDRGSNVHALRGPRRFSFTLPQLVAASLALMVLSGSMVWLARLGGDRTDFPAVAAEVPAAADAPVSASLADAHYEEAIADLQQALEAGRTKLDPGTVRALERNLAAIDEAIAQCRHALASDPANAFLADHLAAAKKRKLALLRRANALNSYAGS
jgi:anti-sigma factor RsiW